MKKSGDDENEAKVQNTKEPEIMRETPQKTRQLPLTIKTNLEAKNENCLRRLHHIDGNDENGANEDEVLCCDIDQTQLKQRRHKRCQVQKGNIKRYKYDLRNIENAFIDTHGISVNMPSASSIKSLPSYSIPTTTTSLSSSSLSSSGSKSSNTTTFVNNYSRRVKTTNSAINNNNSKTQVSHQKYQQQKTLVRRKKEHKQKLKCEETFSELKEKSAVQAAAIQQLIPTPTSSMQCQMEEQQQHQHNNQQVKSSQGNNDMYSKDL